MKYVKRSICFAFLFQIHYMVICQISTSEIEVIDTDRTEISGDLHISDNLFTSGTIWSQNGNLNINDNFGYTWGNTRTAIFGNNTDHYMYFRTNAIERLRINEQGLDVNGSVIATGIMVSNNFNVPDNQGYTWGNTSTAIFGNNSSNYIYFRTAATERMRIIDNGHVGIGTSNPTEKLHVNGKIRTAQNTWADFVFSKNYDLPSLKQVENQIEEYGHLFGIPSEKEVVAEGYIIGDMDAKLLQKIEELTLYLIEQNKKIEELEKKVRQLEKD